MRKVIPIVLSIFLLFFIIGVNLTTSTLLFAPDGQRHFEFSNFENCNSGYANGVCLATGWLDFNEFGFWLFFLGISFLIPIFFVLYTNKIHYFLAWFVFTGFFWNTMLMQVFAQILLTLFFVFFIFHKNKIYKLLVLNALLVLFLFGVKLHNSEFFVLVGVLVFELIVLFSSKVKGLFVLSCGVLPEQSVKEIGLFTNSIRSPLSSNMGNFVQRFIYYFYNLLIENMLFVFVIPGVYEIFRNKDFKLAYYFCFVFFGGLFLWWQSGFEIWWITRVFIWLPVVLFVPFMQWLERQDHFTKTGFIFVGCVYFCFNVWYYLQRMGELNC